MKIFVAVCREKDFTVALEDRETIGRAMNMSFEQIEYLSSLRRGYAAIYAEGDNRPKCVKLPLIQSYYEKNRDEVIKEVKKKVYDIANGYDELILHHAGCSYCEQRCKCYKDVCAYIDANVVTDKVLEKWAVKKYAPRSFQAFLNSELMKSLDTQNIFKQICILGYILKHKEDLNDGQRQKCLSEYLRYVKNN